MKYRLLSLAFLISVIGLLSACEGSKEQKNDSSDEFDQAQSDGDVKSTISNVVHEIPSPSEIPFLLERTGADYDQSVVNDISKVDKYANRNDIAALNLGVYAADIGYLVSYDKVQEALKYMTEVKGLADEMGVTATFDQDLINRFEENLQNKDSLASLLNETIKNVERYLNNDNRNKLAALIVAGSFAEGLYISTQLVDNYPKDILPEDSRNLILTPLIRVILNQEKSVEDLNNLLENVESSEQVDKVKEYLDKLSQEFEKLNIQEQIRNNRADLVLSDETLKTITSYAAEMRDYIVD